MHPLEPELRDLYGVIFWQQEGEQPLTQRNVTVFADGEVDRSPCGSGTSARLALLDAAGLLPRGDELRHLSIVGSAFTGRVVGAADVAGLPAVVTEVTGSAFRTGTGSFVLDPDDPLRRGVPAPLDPAPAGARSWPYAAGVVTEDDALVMYLVVRQRTTRPFAELALAAALSARRCAHRFRTDERWRDGFDDWWRHSFRKVCLRAEPREWEAMRELDHVRVGDVACLPPVRRSQRDRVLVRMQALSGEAGPLPELSRPWPAGLTLVVASGLGMSSGKTLAQIGHAALHGGPGSGARPPHRGRTRRAVAGARAPRRRRRSRRRPDGARPRRRDGARPARPGRAAGRVNAVPRVLIVNPFASGVTESKLAAVQAVLPAGTETVLTRARGEATALAADWSPLAEAIFVFSGDGTYNEVLNGLRADIPVGFIPGGGTSVLPRALGLPRDPVLAAERIAYGKPRRISLGRINGRLFGFNAGIGLDAELVRRVDALGRREDGKRPGDLTFGITVARTLVGHRFRYPPALEIEGLGRAAFALVANCSPYTYAGRLGLRFAPDASFEGGLDLVAPIDVRARAVPGLAVQAVRGRRSGGATLSGHDLDRIVIRCDSPLPAQVDGEDLGDIEEAEIVAVRDALTVLV